MKLYPFVRQERRIGRKDSVFRAQSDQLVDQLFVLAVQVDLVDQIAKPADYPEPLDEVTARSLIGSGELGGKFQRAALGADLAVDANRRLARLAIAARTDDLTAFEQVGDITRVRPVDVDARQLKLDIREHRAGHLGVKASDVALEVFVGFDVFARSAVAAAQSVE